MAALRIDDAARLLGEPPARLRRWCREGCPHTPGRRGRGHALRVDPEAALAWRRAERGEALLMQLASTIPHALAAATVQAWQRADGFDKHRLAGVFVASWYVNATTALDLLREHCATVPEISSLPEAIVRLKKIAGE